MFQTTNQIKMWSGAAPQAFPPSPSRWPCVGTNRSRCDIDHRRRIGVQNVPLALPGSEAKGTNQDRWMPLIGNIYIYRYIIIYIQNIACPADFVVSCSSCFNGNRQLPRKLIPSPKIPVGAKCPAFPTFQTISKVSVSMSQAQIALRKCLNFKTSMKSPQKNPTEIP